MRWRLLHTPQMDGADNMALDEALLARAATSGEAVLRVYTWSRPTISFGRNQAARGWYDVERLAMRGLDVVRRPTGGRAVLHDREVTYSVTAPVTLSGTLRASYGRINAIVLSGLRALGVNASIARPGGRAPIPSTAPCFETPTEGEIVLGACKLVGSAQWRDGDGLLQHGSILLDDDQASVPELLVHPTVPAPAAATVSGALGRRPAVPEIAQALFHAVRALEDAAAMPLAIGGELEANRERARSRYIDPAWTWRR